ncbi:MAG TPA: putative ABC exporter domain-containing protein [Terriglobia bacterium]|nr:putative ABC exporter domain-containing protein [Terriglobia bacterium]
MARLLHPALRLLWRMQLQAGWRRITRSVRTGKGVLRLALTVGLMALTFGPMFVFLLYREPPDSAAARSLLEPAIFVITMVILMANGSKSGIFFTPAEVDFLFPGPFRRKELILYRIGHQAQAALFGALFLSVVPAPFVPYWPFAFLGIALVLQFIQLLSTVLSLTISIAGQAAYSRVRRIVLVVIGLLIVVGVVQAASEYGASGGLALMREFQATSVGAVVLAPFQLFSRTIAAERLFPDFLGWSSLALALNIALIAATLRLDSDFYERSVAVSERVYRALENARRGQAWMGLSKPSVARWRLPMPARLRGAGPIAWRQFLDALRNSRGVIYVVLFIGSVVALAAYFLDESGPGMGATALAMFALFTFPQMLQFDFRGDIERIDLLKTLPASSAAIVAGELIVPIVLATIIESVLMIGTGLLWTGWPTIFVICAFLPVGNLLVFAVENLVFLYYPRRSGPMGTTFQAPGRQMIMNFIKTVVIGIAGGTAAGVGGIAFWLSERSVGTALAAAWCVITVAGVALVPLVARAFRVLDPSLETME